MVERTLDHAGEPPSSAVLRGLAPAALSAAHSFRWPCVQCSAPCSALQYTTALHAEHALKSNTPISCLAHDESAHQRRPCFARSSASFLLSVSSTRVSMAASTSAKAPRARSARCSAGLSHARASSTLKGSSKRLLANKSRRSLAKGRSELPSICRVVAMMLTQRSANACASLRSSPISGGSSASECRAAG